MNFLTKTLAAAAITAVSATAAMATPLVGTFSVDIYQGLGDGSSNNPIEQATNANPLLTSASAFVGTISYTGALNFILGSGGTDTVGGFFAAGGGSTVGLTAAIAGLTLSTAPFATTTLLVFHGFTAHELTGTVSHDDGASLYQGANTIFSSQSPTTVIGTAYDVQNGGFDLYYVEANGLPAVLTMDVATVPEPASLALLGSGLLGLGLIRRRRRQG